MNPVQQFMTIVFDEYYRIEALKAETMERGEIIVNITQAYVNEKIDEETYNDLIARACE